MWRPPWRRGSPDRVTPLVRGAGRPAGREARRRAPSLGDVVRQEDVVDLPVVELVELGLELGLERLPLGGVADLGHAPAGEQGDRRVHGGAGLRVAAAAAQQQVRRRPGRHQDDRPDDEEQLLLAALLLLRLRGGRRSRCAPAADLLATADLLTAADHTLLDGHRPYPPVVLPAATAGSRARTASGAALRMTMSTRRLAVIASSPVPWTRGRVSP